MGSVPVACGNSGTTGAAEGGIKVDAADGGDTAATGPGSDSSPEGTFDANGVAGAGGIGGTGTGEISFAEWPARILAATCAAAVACGIYADDADCRLGIGVDLEQLGDDIAHGVVTYNPKAAATCLAALQAQGGLVLCRRKSRSTLVRPPSCFDVFSGSVPTGGVCLIGEECVDKQCTEGMNCALSCCPSRCLPPPGLSVPVGGNCASSAHCVPEAYCGSEGTCMPRKVLGTDCGGTEECVSGTICGIQAQTGLFKVCREAVGDGQSCGDTVCDPIEDICDTATFKCTPRAVVVSPQNLGGVSFCYFGFACAGPDYLEPQLSCP